MKYRAHALVPSYEISRAGIQERPGRTEVEAAIRIVIRWLGDDPQRDGLIDTPTRVARAYEELFAGYGEDPALILQKTFQETEGYDEMIALRGIPSTAIASITWRRSSDAPGSPTCRVDASSELASSPGSLRPMQNAYRFRND
jgi:hypothetical protein